MAVACAATAEEQLLFLERLVAGVAAYETEQSARADGVREADERYAAPLLKPVAELLGHLPLWIRIL